MGRPIRRKEPEHVGPNVYRAIPIGECDANDFDLGSIIVQSNPVCFLRVSDRSLTLISALDF
jgi:hypothetical protein